MPYLLTDEQEHIRSEARRLLTARRSGEGLKALLETTGRYDEGFWQACREMGWTAITVPEAYGGLGLGPLELCLVAEECGGVTAGAPFLVTSFAVTEALRLGGTEAQKQEWLPPLAAGTLVGCFSAAGEVRSVEGKLFGETGFVTGGAVADLAVMASDRGLVLADLRHRRVSRTVPDTIDNSRCTAVLRFEGVPAAALAAGLDAAALLHRIAVVTAFEQLGGADACMVRARDYAKERIAFGQPIGKFQAIKHRIAEMYVANELARGNALSAALSLAQEGPDLALHAAAARLAATEAYEVAAREAMQIHGGIGVTWEHDLHLYYRRSRALALELGAMFEWEDRLVDCLARKAAG